MHTKTNRFTKKAPQLINIDVRRRIEEEGSIIEESVGELIVVCLLGSFIGALVLYLLYMGLAA